MQCCAYPGRWRPSRRRLTPAPSPAPAPIPAHFGQALRPSCAIPAPLARTKGGPRPTPRRAATNRSHPFSPVSAFAVLQFRITVSSTNPHSRKPVKPGKTR
jgi:hypothetical protein